MFTEEVTGLGVVVTVTTKFYPQRMAARKKYWYDIYYKQIVDDLASQYRSSGFEGLGAEYSPGMLQTGKIPILANILNIVSKIPIVGGIFSSIFGGAGKPKIPWGEIYAQADSLARQYGDQSAIDEEKARIAQEVVQVAEIKQKTGEQRSVEASLFKMPVGITSISRGALVISPVGPAIEKRIEIRKK